jgi:hypothetical protein
MVGTTGAKDLGRCLDKHIHMEHFRTIMVIPGPIPFISAVDTIARTEIVIIRELTANLIAEVDIVITCTMIT